MNRRGRPAAGRSPEQPSPRLLKEYRAPAAAACSHAAAGSTHHARMRSDREPPPPGGPRFAQPGRPTREWSGRLAQTRGQDRQDYVQHGRGRPSVGETPANTVDVFLASAAPPARDYGCPPNRVNPNARLGTRLLARLCRGCHLRQLSSTRLQGATRTEPYGQLSCIRLPPRMFDGWPRPSVRAPASVTRFPGTVSGTCGIGSRSPWPPPFAPPPPLPVARPCSAASLL